MENQTSLKEYARNLSTCRVNSLLRLKLILGKDAYDQAVKKYKASLDRYPVQVRQSKTTHVPDYLWTSAGLPIPQREYRFDPTRRYRIDFAYPDKKIAIEIEGGVFTRGRHVRPMGYVKDMEKYSAISKAGWILLRYLPKKINFKEILEVYNMK